MIHREVYSGMPERPEIVRLAKAPEKEIDEFHKTGLFGEMFCYKRKKNREVLKNGSMT